MPAEANKKIISYLNEILKGELTAINQYFLHFAILKNQGFAKLAAKEYEASIDEMKHAQQLIDRVLYLGGLPNLQDLGRLNIGEHADEILKADLGVEEAAVKLLREAAKFMEENKDYTSAGLVMEILKSEEEHIDWLRQQLNVIGNVGLQNYLQSQI